MTPENALLDAVLAALAADPAVSAIVGDKVMDEVPADRSPVKPPYVYAGPINRQRVPDTCARAWAMRMRVYAVSTGFGRREAWTLADAVVKALHRAELNLSEPLEAVDPVTVAQAGDVINPPAPKTAFVDITVTIMEGFENG